MKRFRTSTRGTRGILIIILDSIIGSLPKSQEGTMEVSRFDADGSNSIIKTWGMWSKQADHLLLKSLDFSFLQLNRRSMRRINSV